MRLVIMEGTVMPAQMIKTRDLVKLDHLSITVRKQLPELLCKFLDVAQTATNRATAYNTKEEQEKAVTEIHKKLFIIDRGLYGICLLLPGVTDYAKKLGIGYFLDNPRDGAECTLTPEQEGRLIAHLTRYIEPPPSGRLY